MDDELWGPNRIEILTHSTPECDAVFEKLAKLVEDSEPSTLTLKDRT